MQSPNSSYNPAIDHVRAMAAVLIVLYHGNEMLLPSLAHTGTYVWPLTWNPFAAVIYEGHTAVGLFMVLSGFIFTAAAIGRSVLYAPFIWNRFLRIYPLMLSILALAIYQHPEMFQLGDFIRSLVLFTQLPLLNIGPTLHIAPWTEIFWTITPEFQFYLIFPALLWLLTYFGPRPLLMLLVGALLCRGTYFAFYPDVSHISYWTIIGRIDEFLIGMLAAAAWRGGLSDRRTTELLFPAACLAVPFILLAYNRAGGWPDTSWWKAIWPSIEGAMWAVFILGYLKFAKRLPRLISAALATVGEASYSSYLLHWPIALFVTGWLAAALTGVEMEYPHFASLLLTAAVVLPPIILISLVTFRLIERPFLRMRVRYLANAESWRTGQAVLAQSAIVPSPSGRSDALPG
jgi:peptidoglycan/LPS O-acetylase OafA/YrhL